MTRRQDGNGKTNRTSDKKNTEAESEADVCCTAGEVTNQEETGKTYSSDDSSAAGRITR